MLDDPGEGAGRRGVHVDDVLAGQRDDRGFEAVLLRPLLDDPRPRAASDLVSAEEAAAVDAVVAEVVPLAALDTPVRAGRRGLRGAHRAVTSFLIATYSWWASARRSDCSSV